MWGREWRRWKIRDSILSLIFNANASSRILWFNLKDRKLSILPLTLHALGFTQFPHPLIGFTFPCSFDFIRKCSSTRKWSESIQVCCPTGTIPPFIHRCSVHGQGHGFGKRPLLLLLCYSDFLPFNCHPLTTDWLTAGPVSVTLVWLWHADSTTSKRRKKYIFAEPRLCSNWHCGVGGVTASIERGKRRKIREENYLIKYSHNFVGT